MEAFFDKIHDEISKCEARIYPRPKGWELMCLLPDAEHIGVMDQINSFMNVVGFCADTQLPAGFDRANITTIVVRGVNIRIIAADVPMGVFAHTISVD